MDIPTLLAGWHLLTRSGAPRWTHVQVKALCHGNLEYEAVHKALLRVFGGDHKPNVKDVASFNETSNKDELFFEDDYEEEYYEDEEDEAWYDGYHEAYYKEDEEVPEDLENAMGKRWMSFILGLGVEKKNEGVGACKGILPRGRSWT